MKRRHILAALVAATLAAPALAQVKPNATAADVANYAGADRAQKLVEVWARKPVAQDARSVVLCNRDEV